MKRYANNGVKRAFTLVELAVVIAVIGILATILVFTFTDVAENSTMSSDKKNADNMNMALDSNDALGFTITTETQLRDLLAECGYSAAAYTPNSLDHCFVWSKLANKVMLMKKTGETYTAVYPENVGISTVTQTEIDENTNYVMLGGLGTGEL